MYLAFVILMMAAAICYMIPSDGGTIAALILVCFASVAYSHARVDSRLNRLIEEEERSGKYRQRNSE